MVICLEKDSKTLDLDCTLAPHSTSGGVFYRRPLRSKLSKVVGTHPSSLSSRSLLHGLLGSIPQRHSRRAAHRVWQREWADGAYRAVEQYIAAATSALRQKNFIVLEVRSDARDLSTFVFAPLQSLTVSHLICPLPYMELILLRAVSKD